ncbi:MAG TPA: hypothetical protein VFX92_03275, partial [Candidatus Krumholzibacteria bacterium]|nr:hypothetical protein [Candidatus Krumholzibacteria bacterium]
QSGDSGVLSRMRRRYDADAYRDFMRRAVARVPGIGLGTDVMVGFPGEDETAFQNSCEMVSALPFVNVHVFSFSARPRTSAFHMGGAVPPAEIRRRSEHLRRLALARQHDMYVAQQGGELQILFEGASVDGTWAGYSDNYVRARVSSAEVLANRMARVAVHGVEITSDGDRVVAVGEILNAEPAWIG